MFNFFLIASGVLAHASVNLICGEYFVLAMGLAIIGIIVSFSFLVLDFRNADLVYMGEDVLRRLEEDSLFPQKFRGLSEKDDETHRGILYREYKEPKTWFQRHKKHKYVLPLIEGVIGICFLFLCIAAVFLRYFDP